MKVGSIWKSPRGVGIGNARQ
jgi:predicted nucleic acid-binding protein